MLAHSGTRLSGSVHAAQSGTRQGPVPGAHDVGQSGMKQGPVPAGRCCLGLNDDDDADNVMFHGSCYEEGDEGRMVLNEEGDGNQIHVAITLL